MSLISLSENVRTLNGDKKNVDNHNTTYYNKFKRSWNIINKTYHTCIEIKLSQYKDISL